MSADPLSTRAAAELAVMASFDPRRLDTADPAIGELLSWHTIEVQDADGHTSLILSENARIEALAAALREGGKGALARLREKVTPHFESTMQDVLDGYVRDDLPPIEARDEDALGASLHVVRWMTSAHARADSRDGPSPSERVAIEGRLQVMGVTRPITDLLVNGFVGRTTELERLHGFRHGKSGGSLHDAPAFVLYGVGGMGKSTLVARFVKDVIDEVEAREGKGRLEAWAYLDFDRATLRPRSPTSRRTARSRAQLVFDDIVRQVGAQHPALASLLASSSNEAQRQTAMAGLESIGFGERDEETAFRLGALIREVLGDGELVVVLDTFEEVERGGPSAAWQLRQAFEKFASVVPRLRLVVSGRVPAATFRTTTDFELQVGELDDAGTREVLSLFSQPDAEKREPVDEATAKEIGDLVGRSPLTLRLAAQVLSEVGLEALEDAARRAETMHRMQAEFVRGFLYHRILDHIVPQDTALRASLRAVARAGLVLRSIDQAAIEEILLPAVGVSTEGGVAGRLFDALHNEVAIVDARAAGVLSLRRDLREPALAALELDDSALVRRVREAAIPYYQRTKQDAEVVYHRLALGADLASLDIVLTPEIRESLRGSLADLPRVTVRQLDASDVQGTSAVIDAARELASWELRTLSGADTALRDGRLDEAERLLAERNDRSGTSQLHRLQSRVCEARGDLGAAVAAARRDLEASQLSEEPTRIAAAGVRLAMLQEWRGHKREALEILAAAEQSPALRGEWALRLELTLDRMAFAERTGLETEQTRWEWGLQARRLLGRLDPADRDGHVVARMLAAVLGREEPRYIREAIDKMGLDPHAHEQRIEGLAAALFDWDISFGVPDDMEFYAVPGPVADETGLVASLPDDGPGPDSYTEESWADYLQVVAGEAGGVFGETLWAMGPPLSVLEALRQYFLYQGFDAPDSVSARVTEQVEPPPQVHSLQSEARLRPEIRRELERLIRDRYSDSELEHLAARVNAPRDWLASPRAGTVAAAERLGVLPDLIRVVLDDAGEGALANRLRDTVGSNWLARNALGGGIMSKLDVARAAEGAGLQSAPLPDFVSAVPSLSPAEKQLIIDQALVLMDELYVHLPLKRAMYATDPVQRLKLLRHRMPDDRTFHEEMISIFMSVHDLHTNYVLPQPYQSATAVLPLRIGEFYDGDTRRYIVFATAGDDPDFRPGMPITHLNGVPIERAVELNARRHAGGNDAAKHARGLQRMTVRPLMMSLPPDEEWVDVRYLDADGKPHERRFSWTVLSDSGSIGRAPEDSGKLTSEAAMVQFGAIGLDAENEVANDIIKKVFQHERLEIEADVLAYLEGGGLETIGGVDLNKVSTMPKFFSFETLDTRHGKVGRIAIHSFAVNDPDAFVKEFVRIAKLLPQDGLIIDVRHNGGGNIIAGELLLQTLTTRTIEPERLHFLNTKLTLAIAEGMPIWFDKWIPSLRRALETGAVYSQGWSLRPQKEYNALGRQYPGPVVLLTNAFCYSTTDIFAAGFQDHEIGRIIGTDGNTGAGGANVFDWHLMKTLGSMLPENPIADPPQGATFRVAIRRTTRVGSNAGEPLEDLGVVPDEVHRTTLQDLINHDVDLFARAAQLLKS